MQKKKQRQRRNDGKPYIKIIDWVFHNEQEIRQAIIDERNKAAGNPLVRNASKISKPTEVAVMQEMVPPPPLPVVILKEDDGELKYLEHPERWLVVIDRTYAWCKRQKGCYYEAAHRRYNGESYKIQPPPCLISSMMYEHTLPFKPCNFILLKLNRSLSRLENYHQKFFQKCLFQK